MAKNNNKDWLKQVKTENTEKTTEEGRKFVVSFAAINPYTEINVISPTETQYGGKGYVTFGENNKYPSYLYSLYKEVSTLQAIINGIGDYTVGEGVISHVNALDDAEAEELVRACALSYGIWGGFYINVLRNAGGVGKVEVLDYRKVRTDADHENFYYSNAFASCKSYSRDKMLIVPSFELKPKAPSSVYYYSNNHIDVYALPMWCGATLAAECERQNNLYQKNAVMSGFSSPYIINFQNGIPTDEQKEEIERAVYDKFCGANSAGLPLLNFCDDKEHGVSVEAIEQTDFADRYAAMSTRCRQEIFTSFRASPQIFGIPTAGSGFSREEYEQAYALFNRTVIRPIQKAIINSFDKIFGVENSIEILPFNLELQEENNTNEDDNTPDLTNEEQNNNNNENEENNNEQ